MRLNEIHREFAGRVDCYCVYIREAHPDDGWQVSANVDEGVVFNEPRTLDERAHLAGVCSLELDLEMPVLLDDMSNTVDALYNALPERLYLLDASGRIAWKSLAGPWGFDPEGWRAAMAALVG